MKERLSFTLDMDMLKGEAARASMSVEQWPGGLVAEATEITLIASNYVHPVSVVGQLLTLIRDKLEVVNFWLVDCFTNEYDSSSTRIRVIVAPRNKEQSHAS